MKPKTKIQIAVSRAAKLLPGLSKEQIQYACDDFFIKKAYCTKNAGFCLECGEDIDVSQIVRKRVTCENCGEKLRIVQTRKRKDFDGNYYFAVAQLMHYDNYDFQVVRVFQFIKFFRKGFKHDLRIHEVTQNWYEASGKHVIYSCLINGFNGSYCLGEMEIRNYGNRGWYTKNYDITPDLYCFKSQFRPEYLQKGISHKLRYMTLNGAINKVVESKAETLMKAGYYEILANWNYASIYNFWPALKICMRNKYKIKDPSIYLDLLKALQYLNKDIHNSHFVCPKNMRAAHDFYIDKVDKIKYGKELANHLKKADKENPKFIKQKSNFFGLELQKGRIKISPLRSVYEFLNEGEVLKHCVFKGEYYNRKDSLILSARINNKPVETIEISLRDYKISQAYGYKNKPSKHHNQIVSLVDNNMDKIRKIASS